MSFTLRHLNVVVQVAVLFTACFLLTPCQVTSAQGIRSPDGKYEAKPLPSAKDPKDVHYEVREVATGRLVLTTFAQYPTANDVKAGKFSPDSKRFAAAYHYGHDGNYTWIGIWSVATGKLTGSPIRVDGWVRDVTVAFQRQP